ncbi:MAG: sel1 repeat family protein [Planctomycetes bacterium]|nr:sel1 repeat family protein [Planctomycetota bacterium]
MKNAHHRILAAVAAALLTVTAVRAADTAQGETQVPPQQQQISPGELFLLMAGEAEKGNAEAMLTLGSLYERGVGTPRNFVKAFEWYRKAADAGLAAGFYNVGVCYEIGMGTSGSPVEAFTNFEKSAELGLAQGLYKLASLYFTGLGTSKNEPWGVELLNRAAANGHMAAANDLGVIFYEGTFGQQKDINKAFEWFTRSAELGNGEAMKNLAIFFRDGVGRPADPRQELKWYLLSAAAGFPAQALAPAVEKIKADLSEDDYKKVEAEAQDWIAAFRQRQQAAQPQR